MVNTTIRIDQKTLKKLKKIKFCPQESYDHIINRLIEVEKNEGNKRDTTGETTTVTP